VIGNPQKIRIDMQAIVWLRSTGLAHTGSEISSRSWHAMKTGATGGCAQTLYAFHKEVRRLPGKMPCSVAFPCSSGRRRRSARCSRSKLKSEDGGCVRSGCRVATASMQRDPIERERATSSHTLIYAATAYELICRLISAKLIKESHEFFSGSVFTLQTQ
jgi:hypothetical protein